MRDWEGRSEIARLKQTASLRENELENFKKHSAFVCRPAGSVTEILQYARTPIEAVPESFVH